MLPSYHYEPYSTGVEPFTLPMLTPPDYLFDFCIVQDQWCSGFTFTSVAADPLRPDQNGRYLADDILECIVFEQMLMLISSIFVPEGLVNKYWNNCERRIPVVKGNLPGAAQYWLNGNCISVWFWHMYMFTGSIHLTYLIPGTGGVYILVD